MTHAPIQPFLWLPPKRLRQYVWVRVGGCVLFGVIFIGWMILQWSNPVIRWIAGALVVVTAWGTIVSILTDARRARGRQIIIEPDTICIHTPKGTKRIRLADIDRAAWLEDSESNLGLWLYDGAGNVLAHLDGVFLADQAEARAFLGWTRRHADINFSVRWPAQPA